jgi:hypothetical protein
MSSVSLAVTMFVSCAWPRCRLYCHLPRVACAHWIVGDTTRAGLSAECLEAHRKRFGTFYSSMGLLDSNAANRLVRGKPLGDSLSLLLVPEKQGEYAPVAGGTSVVCD